MRIVLFALLLALLPLQARAEVSITRKIHYGPDDQQTVDVYQPDMCKSGGHECPVALWVHGGGWRHGDTSGEASTTMQTLWARQGIVMVGVNYRLSPRVMHPVHVEDVAAAIAWVHQNIAKYGGKPVGISLLGHSAGAHLVALVATNPRFLEKHKLEPCDVLGNVFPVDTASFDLSQPSPFVKRLIMEAFGDDPATLADASPIAQVHEKGCYPSFIMAATKVRQDAVNTTEKLADELKKAGTSVRVVIKDYPGLRQLQAHGAIAKELADPDSDMTKMFWQRVLE